MSDPTRPSGSDKEWETLLRELRPHPLAVPKPFFYARVQARLVAQAGAVGMLPYWLRRPVFAAVLGALVLAVSGDGAGAATAPASHPAHQLAP